MDNQHQQIKGYRELREAEIALMNLIKTKAEEVGKLIFELENHVKVKLDIRWLNIARTQLQQGFMALTRSVAKPDFF